MNEDEIQESPTDTVLKVLDEASTALREKGGQSSSLAMKLEWYRLQKEAESLRNRVRRLTWEGEPK